jgi:hypothetical protein
MRALFALPCLLALVAIAGCTTRDAPRESSAGECSNGADDDLDGALDCEDTGCAPHAFCSLPGGDGGSFDGGPAPILDGGPPGDRMIGPSCSAPLDVGFVIDVSTSMADEAELLRVGIESIWNAAQDLTTNTQFTLVVFVDDALAVGGCAPFADLGTLQSELARWRDFCASNQSPVSMSANTDCAENSLDALHLAATGCPWRAGATRVLIHVTDDTFAERPTRLSGFLGTGGVVVQHTYAEVRDALVAAEIRVGAFARTVPAECGAGTSPDVGRGFHTPFMGMPSLPTATGGRVWDISELGAGEINALLEDEYCTLF